MKRPAESKLLRRVRKRPYVVRSDWRISSEWQAQREAWRTAGVPPVALERRLSDTSRSRADYERAVPSARDRVGRGERIRGLLTHPTVKELIEVLSEAPPSQATRRQREFYARCARVGRELEHVIREYQERFVFDDAAAPAHRLRPAWLTLAVLGLSQMLPDGIGTKRAARMIHGALTAAGHGDVVGDSETVRNILRKSKRSQS